MITHVKTLSILWTYPDSCWSENSYQPGRETFNRRPEMKILRKLMRNEKGATAIEYGLIATLIAIAAITAMSQVGTKLGTTFNNVSGKLNAT